MLSRVGPEFALKHAELSEDHTGVLSLLWFWITVACPKRSMLAIQVNGTVFCIIPQRCMMMSQVSVQHSLRLEGLSAERAGGPQV